MHRSTQFYRKYMGIIRLLICLIKTYRSQTVLEMYIKL